MTPKLETERTGKENERQLESERHMGLVTARIGMLLKGKQQCSGSITFWGGSGSADPGL
jgi:hypothetical protein